VLLAAAGDHSRADDDGAEKRQGAHAYSFPARPLPGGGERLLPIGHERPVTLQRVACQRHLDAAWAAMVPGLAFLTNPTAPFGKETTTAFDKLTITANGTTLATFSNLNHNTGYAQHTFSLGGRTGSVTIKFSGTEDSSLQTSFVVDDTAVTTG
jgi:hypothetical protein